MSWGLASGRVSLEEVDLSFEFTDIESLNRMALDGALELTALSAATYPKVANRYRLLRAGASFGAEYGPLVVALPDRRDALVDADGRPSFESGTRIAVPGANTTAHLLLRIYAGSDFEAVETRFDRVMGAVLDGEVDAGLIIHEGQLTYESAGLVPVFEPARAWRQERELPLPLGVMAVRRDLGETMCHRVARAFRASIDAALEHPETALEFARRHGRGLDPETLHTFVDQYVDELTLDMGSRGLSALEALYRRAAETGLLDAPPRLDPL